MTDDRPGFAKRLTLKPKEPRAYDEGHLRFIRTQPCCICGGIDVEAHHPRVGSLKDGVDAPGGGAKASDRWALPLCNRHHRECHSMSEAAFWASFGIDPFALAMRYRR